jgi:anti-sigma B factor antagonist
MTRTPVPFEVRRERGDRVHRLVAAGELDLATVDVLERAFENVYHDEERATIVVDLTEVTFMDSTGIGLLVRMNEACESAGRLRIVNGSHAVARVLDITGVRRQLPIISGEDDPLAPVGRVD